MSAMASKANKNPEILFHENWPTFLIIAFAIVLRILLRSEIIIGQGLYSFQMAQDAWNLVTSGFHDVRGNIGVAKTVLVLPLAAIYKLFGFSQFGSIAISLASSVVNLLILRAIAKRFFGLSAALLTTLIWSVLPTDILLSGVVSPAIPLLTLSLLSIYLPIEFYQSQNWRTLLLGLPCISGSLLYAPELGIPCLIFAAVVVLFQIKKSVPFRATENWPYIVLGLTFIGLAILFSSIDINRASMAIRSLAHTPGILIHAVLFTLSIPFLANYKKKESKLSLLFLWLASGTIGLCYAFLAGVNAGSLLSSASLNFFLFPIVILEGTFLSSLLRTKSSNWLGATILLLAACFIGLIRAKLEWIPSYEQFSLLAPYAILDYANIAGGLAIVGLICWPWLSSNKIVTKYGLEKALVFVTIFAMVPAVWQTTLPFRSVRNSATEGLNFIKSQPYKMPVFFIENEKLDLYTFVQGLDGSKKEDSLVLRKAPEVGRINDAYVVVPEKEVQIAPASWWNMTATGLMFDRDLIFRSLTPDSVNAEIQGALVENESPEMLDRLFAAQQNAREFCASFSTWMRARLNSYPSASIRISSGLGCFENQIEVSAPVTETLPIHYPLRSIFQIRQGIDNKLNKNVWMIYHEEFIYPDPRTFSFDVQMEPNSFYVYTGWFKANEETVFLYWKLGEQENFVSRQRSPEWTQFGALIYSGNETPNQLKIMLSPALIDNYGFVYFYDLKFTKVYP